MATSIGKIAVGICFVLLVLTVAGVFCCHVSGGFVVSSARPTNSLMTLDEIVDNVDYGTGGDTNLFPVRRSIASTEKMYLKHRYEEIAEAYANRQMKVMLDLFSGIEAQVLDLHDQVYIEIKKPLSSAFDAAFLRREHLMKFSSTSAFSEYASFNLKTARLLGGTSLRRRDCSVSLPYIEWRILYQLKRYRDYFSSQGRMDMQKCTESFLADWIAHIESSEGFTRNYMRLHRDLQFEGVRTRKRALTSDLRNKIMSVVREDAMMLVNAGYTPTWLDREFTLRSEDVLQSR